MLLPERRRRVAGSVARHAQDHRTGRARREKPGPRDPGAWWSPCSGRTGDKLPGRIHRTPAADITTGGERFRPVSDVRIRAGRRDTRPVTMATEIGFGGRGQWGLLARTRPAGRPGRPDGPQP